MSTIENGASRANGSGRNAGLNRNAKSGNAYKGGKGGGGAPRKSKKDIAKDKMLILVELLIGLLLLSFFAFGAAKLMSTIGALRGSGLADETFRKISNKIFLVVILEVVGILAIFGGMLLGRVFRLPVRVRLTKKQKTILICIGGLGVLLLLIAGFMGFSLSGALGSENKPSVNQIISSASNICYVVFAAMLFIVAAPVCGGMMYWIKDRGTAAVKKAGAFFLKIAGAALILTGIGLVSYTVSDSMSIMRELSEAIVGKMDNDTATNTDDLEFNDISEEAQSHMSGYINIAVFGLDSRADKNDNKDGLDDSDSRSDVIMIISVNCDTKEVKLLSVYRDTCMLIQKKKGSKVIDNYEKITHAYFNGNIPDSNDKKGTSGPRFALNALNRNLDLNIGEYVSVNFDIVRQVIESLGGLEIDIDSGELKYINQYIDEINKLSGTNSPHVTQTGLQHLDGVQATGYARIRHSDSDYKRTERQREVVQLMFNKAKEQGLGKVLEIVNLVAPQIRTNIDSERVLELANDVLNYTIVDQKGFPFDPYWDGGQSVVFAGGSVSSGKSLVDEVKELHVFLFGNDNYSPSSKLIEISAELDAKRGKKGSTSSSTKSTSKPLATEEVENTPAPTRENNNSVQKVTAAPTTVKPATPAPSTPEPPAQTPEPPASTPEPPASTPEPPVSTPEPPVSTPEPPAQTPIPDDDEEMDDPGL